MLNIVVPMAGRGSRFSNSGYKDPKPLISVGGKPMIQWVIDNVRPAQPHRFIFICLNEHIQTYPRVPATLQQLCPECEIVTVDKVTEGAACTVLLARRFIDNNDALMIANADQFVELKIDEYLAKMEVEQADGLIMTFWSDHPKWSYCKLRADGSVQAVVEKKVVSNDATVGIYNFRRGSDFVRAADMMIARNLRVNNEFYVAPTYNQLIEEGSKVSIASTGREYDGMFGLGVPEDLDFFKTTMHYTKGWLAGSEPVPDNTILHEYLSKIYAKFFNDRNLAGLVALLADDVVIEGRSETRLVGKDAVISYIQKVYRENPHLCFTPRTITSAVDRSVIEFTLKLGDKLFKGTVVIEWSSRKLSKVRTYIY